MLMMIKKIKRLWNFCESNRKILKQFIPVFERSKKAPNLKWVDCFQYLKTMATEIKAKNISKS